MEITAYAIDSTIGVMVGAFGAYYFNWNPFAITIGWIAGTVIFTIIFTIGRKISLREE